MLISSSVVAMAGTDCNTSLFRGSIDRRRFALEVKIGSITGYFGGLGAKRAGGAFAVDALFLPATFGLRRATFCARSVARLVTASSGLLTQHT
jgi:hypothetical protein